MEKEEKAKKSKKYHPQRIAVSKNGMVSTQHYKATEAGKEILEEGGNAIDAAIASAFALGVCEPQSSGIGGQTMMLIHIAKTGKTIAVDGSSRAPNRATIENLTDKSIRLHGYRATTVPSTPTVLTYILEKYGTLPLSRILEPSIKIAEEGYIITELQNRLQKREAKKFTMYNGAELFLNKGKAYKTGSVFKQKVLANTLRTIAKKGIEEFYLGNIAKIIEDDMIKNDALIRLDDLARIPYPIEREPIYCDFKGMKIMTFPPPAAGRTLIEMLNILKHFSPKQYNPMTPEGALLLVEIIKQAQLDRNDRPYYPNLYPQIDDPKMLSPDYAKKISKRIRNNIKTSGDTTHLSVMDKCGNVVSLTQSVERVYGSYVVTPELGFLYNNYMSAFDYNDISHPYYLRPNSVPWASVAPTIVFKGKKPYICIGSPGSERISSSILQVLIRLDYQTPLDSISAPRLHCSRKGKVSIEATRMLTSISKLLEKKGYIIDVKEPYSFYLGCVQMVMNKDDNFIGIADPRRDGSADGPGN